MREAVKRHVLGRPKLRQSWNKYNLYNTYRVDPSIPLSLLTFFQQKWAAKAATRSYHGEHVNEKRWNRLFSRRLTSAVEMPPEYLAAYDGAEQAEGRGSGRELDPSATEEPVTADSFSVLEKARRARVEFEESKPDRRRPGPRTIMSLMRKPTRHMTPYMQMAYAPLERRLEVAMFRAMFASSPRQARQFCIHGAVKVNGKKMRYGSYMLNPGDMFEVDPDKVLYAAGKDKNQASLEAAVLRVQAKEKAKKEAEEESIVETTEGEETTEAAEAKIAEEAKAKAEEVVAAEEVDLDEIPAKEREAEQRRRVKALIRSAKEILKDDPELNAKRKQELRAFVKASKSALGHKEDLSSADLINKLGEHLSRFSLDDTAIVKKEQQKDGQVPIDQAAATEEEELVLLLHEEQDKLGDILRANEKDDENPIDPSKPYATPWEPRKFLEPFAFIPRYLEVNQNICAAVYLRHPVARRGLAEVPTPFPYDINQLAYTWYLRRR